jgi:predicted metal-dependent hydrolase|tara:strand:- start:230 stop:601 length:372 start_codon:yes stop_codon:yes gene_type:complete
MLKSILTELNDEYFDGKVKVNEIRWMKKKLLKVFGRCDLTKKVIEINSILRSNPRVLKFVVMHELCHLADKRHKKGRKHHTKAFWERFKKYPNFEAENRLYHLFIGNYWVNSGYMKKEDLRGN